MFLLSACAVLVDGMTGGSQNAKRTY